MIRYPVEQSQIEEAVNAKSSSWRERAIARTKLFADLGKYAESYIDPAGDTQTLSPFWSEVKSIYTDLQHNKCIYCETKLEGGQSGAIQWDLEHFRPKSSVRKWPGKNSPYGFATGDGLPNGYYLLAYHLGNYAAACKTCNSPFKSDYFPVASDRIVGRSNPEDYSSEKAFLVYPIGNGDTDPEELITFIGAEAVPRYKFEDDEEKWRRGRVIIDFFGLNRDGLQYNRARWLNNTIWPNIKLADMGDEDGIRLLRWAQSERAPFTNCAKCFVQLCSLDRQKVEALLPHLQFIVDSMEA